MLSKHLFGGILLVAGTAIGAGMLALPIVTAAAGFFPSFFIFLLCWAFMSCTGLLMLEVCLRLPPGANLISMASMYLGRPGKAITWLLYLFLFYSLSIAYIAGGGSLLRDWMGEALPSWAAATVFLALLAPIVMGGALYVDRLNRLLMIGLILSYFVFLILGFSRIQPFLLETKNWSLSWSALPVIFTSFSYQGVIPPLVGYLRRDAKSLRIAILGGTTLAFLVYLFWEFLILGVVPQESLVAAKEMGQTAVAPLKKHISSGVLFPMSQAFAFFAIATSFLGVTLGLFDFLADGFKLPKKGIRLFLLACLTFGPPFVIALFNPSIFISALGFAGGIGCALLLGLLPTCMAWSARYVKKETEEIQLGGGKILLFFLLLFILFELFIELKNSVAL